MTTNRKLTIGGASRAGVTTVYSGDTPIAIFLPGAAKSDPKTFAEAVTRREVEASLTAPDWNGKTEYKRGERVAHDGQVWECDATSICNSLFEPGSAISQNWEANRGSDGNPRPAWKLIKTEEIETPGQAEASAARGIYPAFHVGMKVKRGDRVTHKGTVWECTSASRDEATPISSSGVPGETLAGDESLWRKIGPAVAVSEDETLERLLSPSMLTPKPGETFTDFMRRTNEASGITGGIADLLVRLAETMDDGEPFPEGGRKVAREDKVAEAQAQVFGGGGDEADDCDCGACMLRRHFFTPEGTLRPGVKRKRLRKVLAMLRTVGSTDKAVDDAANRVVATIFCDERGEGVVAVVVPKDIDPAAIDKAVKIKLGDACEAECVATL